MPESMPPEVKSAFATYREANALLGEQLLLCRELIFDAAGTVDEIGTITETLKWGQPSYLTEATGSGSTIRLAPAEMEAASGGVATTKPALFVHCATDLIEQFKTFYPATFDYQGKRALVIRDDIAAVREELRHCMALALTYKLRKRKV
ncbi:MAG: DUF1801 domain-containing protein [Rhizobiaceae bacterium]